MTKKKERNLRKKKISPRPPEIMKKGGAHKDRKKALKDERERKHKGKSSVDLDNW